MANPYPITAHDVLEAIKLGAREGTAQAMKEMFETGSAKVQLTGRNGVPHVLVDAVAITNTSNHFSAALPGDVLRRYRRVLFFVNDSHNTSIRLRFMRSAGMSASDFLRQWNDEGELEAVEIATGNDPNVRRWMANDHPKLQRFLDYASGFHDGLRIRYTAETAPSSGALTIVALGVPN